MRPFEAGHARTSSGGTRSPGNAGAPGDASRPSGRPPHRSRDVRYSRPHTRVVRPVYRGHVRVTVPRYYGYRPYYTRWYCHPWYRYRYSTVAVVGFGFSVYAWNDWWIPPARAGWRWSPGYWAWGYWHPGHWVPIRTAPVGYVYVPGWWEDEVYVEGYYRSEARADWAWTDGYYLDDGTHVRGHWAPSGPGPEGYVWEPGFWDGEAYVDGFWRPEFRVGYLWVSAFYDTDGILHSGYWVPDEERRDEEWIPGWFDGNEWVEGYWVPLEEMTTEALESWVPPEGYDDGWDEPTPATIEVPEGAPPEAVIIPAPPRGDRRRSPRCAGDHSGRVIFGIRGRPSASRGGGARYSTAIRPMVWTRSAPVASARAPAASRNAPRVASIRTFTSSWDPRASATAPHDTVGDAGLTDPDQGIEGVGEGLEVAALARGEGHRGGG